MPHVCRLIACFRFLGSGPGTRRGPSCRRKATLRLTTRSVAALPVTGKDTVYWDRNFRGFGVRNFAKTKTF